MMKLLKNEKGVASILGMFVLSILLLLGTAVFYLSANEMLVANNFQNGIQAQLMAESGIEAALEKIHNDNELWLRIGEKMENQSCIVEINDSEIHGRCQVYVTKTEEQVVLMAVSRVFDSSGQIFVYLKPENNGFTIVRWER
jgi:Tfp pilus assembly protein PilX